MGEIRRAVEYDYIVVNDDLSEAVSDVATVIGSERLRLSRQRSLIEKILG